MMSSPMRTRPASSRQAWGNSDKENEDFLQQLESLKKKFLPFDDTMRKMEQQYAETKAAVYLLKEEYQSKNMIEMERLKKQNKHYEQEIERKDRKIKELTEEMTRTKNELERTKTRLSQVMGNKLTNNNPNIADLSDVNRPSKLAERLNEIYDNEWTDAYTELCKENNEEETVAELFRTLMIINEHCKQLWKQHMSNLEKNLTGGQDIDIPDYVKKQLKDCAKTMATQLVEFVYKNFIQMVASGQRRRIFYSLQCEQYIKGCVEVCWFMAAQDPPVVFDTESNEGDKFDPKVFKPFTRTGDLISFVVWPPLYLQEGGPLLSKGVAQTYRIEKKPRTGISAHHMPLRLTDDQLDRLDKQQSYSNSQDLFQSDISGMNLYDREDHSQATSQQTFNPQVHTQQIKTYAWKNEQEPSKYQQSTLNLTSNHVHQQQIGISGKSQDPTLEAMNPSLVWNQSRRPTESQMRRFSYLVAQTSVQAARRIMGDQLFDLCYDFNKFKTELALLDRSTNESDI